MTAQALLTGFEQSADRIIFYHSEESVRPEKNIRRKCEIKAK